LAKLNTLLPCARKFVKASQNRERIDILAKSLIKSVTEPRVN